MAKVSFRGGAPTIARVEDWLFGGTWEATDEIRIAAGSKLVVITANSTVITTVIDTVVAAFNALLADVYPEFTGHTGATASRSGNNLRFTANTEGVPFSFTVTTTEAGGGAADLQTITGPTVITANSGPDDASIGANYSSGALPVAADDLVLERPGLAIRHGLTALSAIALGSVLKAATWDGDIGLPETNPAGYPEYRQKDFQLNSPTYEIDRGQGPGSGLVRLDGQAVASTWNVYGSGRPLIDGVPATLIKNVNVASVLHAMGGSIGAAFFTGEVSTFATIRVDADADLVLGAGVTWTTIEQNGGNIEANSGGTTIRTAQQPGGTCVLNEGNVPTLDLDGGTTVYNGAGTLGATSWRVGDDAVFDGTQSVRPFTVGSTIQATPGATIKLPLRRVVGNTYTVDHVRGALGKIALEAGEHVRAALSIAP